ncbi:2-oxoacid:acceptor oxidoreductase subunit alpha [Silvibacterium dinghuense]|uniref:2-oxoacid:acceptor oxidoreductase subunit alpha n=1 Tax=Silvibacterium dinghuense TaxID=1560006 RepID=A0A4Q1SEN8_9BACT|nr:2-oxoacid:acceptor oxidoreductase subunit alpha [Silvibacterium dinghuense]RXS95398.1 2-oxoacid:acceptor oxidoreductase subunit alpha [Silvibacterium dinghuense]GGH12926.1 pyruvate ferredoxin oxidoreductase [Silvibacterium dinghuense]
MATGDVALGNPEPSTGTNSDLSGRKPVINDFSIQVATVNGSGSQSANSILLRSIFGMGIPVSGKNLFPSNIAGLPTWYTIRASKNGYVARKKDIDIVVAMNAETAKDDILSLPTGGVAVYEASFALEQYRSDVTCYPVPFDKLTAAVCPEARLRKLVKNMIYVGVVAKIIGLDMKAVEKALRKQFAKKQKAADLNWAAVEAGYNYASETFTKQDPFVLEPMHATDGKIIIDGNAACALGALFAGVTVVTWYPITPSSSVVESLIDLLKKYRIEPDGKASFAVVQAEDELAAVGMVLGAGWAGARSMTATSGPGISLMAEFAGLGYWAELPGVIFDIQRVGPSTGLPTRTAQADLLSIAYLSHGDTKHVMLLPGSVKECYEFSAAAFDLTERLQTPVFVVSDLDLGMNNWMSEPFEYPTKPLDRGKVLTAEDLTRLGGFARYKDVDGDAIPYRTLPGTDHPQAAYFTRGSGHNEKALYTEKPDDYQNMMERLDRKFETARTLVPAPVVVANGTSKIGILAFGTSDFAITESRDQLKNEYQFDTDYLRIRAFPFSKEVQDFVASHERVYVVEQNRDAQLLSLLKLDLPAGETLKLRSIRHYNGLPIDARSVTDELVLQEGI